MKTIYKNMDFEKMECKKHNIGLECLAGESAHHSNWYCPVCEKEEPEQPTRESGMEEGK